MNGRLAAAPVVTVIGIGNPLRSDDGVGYLAAETLAQEGWGALPVRVEALRQLLVEHVDLVRDAAHVVFLDAAVDLPAGAILVDELTTSEATSVSFHDLAPATLLSMAGALFGTRKRGTLVRIGVESLDTGEGLSATLASRFGEFCGTARDLVEERALAIAGVF